MQRLSAHLSVVVALALVACSQPPREVEVIFGDGVEGEGDVVSEGEGEGDVSEGEGEGAQSEGEGEDDGLVDVGHKRELRGAWVATVYGINWPSNPSGTAASKQTELENLINTLADSGVNAVFFQARPESDAMYRSDLEPWSRFITGTQGRDPGFDPLEVAITTAHARGIELHAWLNPYRGLSSSSTTPAANHVSQTLSAAAIDYDGQIWMDPASTSVRAHVVDVVTDIVDRYDIDGVHFDDYFYPYPGGGGEFPDAGAFSDYQDAGGTASKLQWRRDNVNALIEDVSVAIEEHRASVRFGVSPFGIYKNGVPEGISGLDAFNEISCDPVTWIDNDWVDYLAPQLYWPTTQTAQAFGTLLPWWASLPDGDGRFIVAGLNLTELGSDDWDLDEYRAEIDIVRNHDDDGAKGVILYHADPLLTDQDGVRGVFGDELWPQATLPPPVVKDARVPSPPQLTQDGAVVSVVVGAGDKGVVVYSDVAGEFVVDRIVFGASSITLSPGRHAITAVGQNDRESRGVVVTVTDP